MNRACHASGRCGGSSRAIIHSSQVGGNDALRKFFKKHKLLDLSIAEKYNSPEAELYRERCVWCGDVSAAARGACLSLRTLTTRLASILALRDGRQVPTSLSQPSQPRTSNSRAPAHETPLERHNRLKREAGDRLRAKFGDGGLKGKSLSGGTQYARHRPTGNNQIDLSEACVRGW